MSQGKLQFRRLFTIAEPRCLSFGSNGNCRLSTTPVSTSSKSWLRFYYSVMLSISVEMHSSLSSSPSLHLHSWLTYIASRSVCDLGPSSTKPVLYFQIRASRSAVDSETVCLSTTASGGRVRGRGGFEVFAIDSFPKSGFRGIGGETRVLPTPRNAFTIVDRARTRCYSRKRSKVFNPSSLTRLSLYFASIYDAWIRLRRHRDCSDTCSEDTSVDYKRICR